MKNLFRYLSLSLLLVSTTFCSKEQQTPTPASVQKGTASSNAAYTVLGFNARYCDADTAGTGAILYREARSQSPISDTEFASIKSLAIADRSVVITADRRVSGSPYDDRINRFNDMVNNSMAGYDDYISRYELYGAVEDPQWVKNNIRHAFEMISHPVYSDGLTSTQQEELTALTDATRPQLERALALYDALFQCEPASLSAQAATTNKKEKQAVDKRLITKLFRK